MFANPFSSFVLVAILFFAIVTNRSIPWFIHVRHFFLLIVGSTGSIVKIFCVSSTVVTIATFYTISWGFKCISTSTNSFSKIICSFFACFHRVRNAIINTAIVATRSKNGGWKKMSFHFIFGSTRSVENTISVNSTAVSIATFYTKIRFKGVSTSTRRFFQSFRGIPACFNRVRITITMTFLSRKEDHKKDGKTYQISDHCRSWCRWS